MPGANIRSISQARGHAASFARRDELVAAHLHIVPPIARNVQKRLPPSFDIEDLISEGTVGLLRAAERYAPASHAGTPFSAYARPRIRGAILDSVRRRAWIENTANPLDDAPESTVEPAGPCILIRGFAASPRFARGQGRFSERLTSAIRRLPARQRLVVGIYYGGHARTFREAAEWLGRRPEEVQADHDAALLRLRTLLGPRNMSEVRAGQLNFTLGFTLDREAA